MSDGPMLLLVEDSDTQALQLRLMLESEGFGVERAASAEEALDRLNAQQPDLLIVDYRLPGMNGDELARTVRLNARTATLPILMLTEERAGEIERQGLDSGANAYVPKSNNRALLLARLRALLRRGRQLPGEPSAGFRRARVLIVDEGATRRVLLAGVLERDGYMVDAVATVGEARARLAAGQLDCLVIGFGARPEDTLALCREADRLRGAAGGAGFEIIALDAGDDQAAVMEVFDAGVDDVLPNLADRETLLVRMRVAIRRKFARDEEARTAADTLARDSALARAEAEAAAADALAHANGELEAANRRLTETQAQLVQAGKMASLGELVAGIAHEINNPLAFIMAHQATVDRLVQSAAADPAASAPGLERAHHRLATMAEGLQRIQELVMKLRRFSRLDESAFAEIAVAPAIEEVIALLSPKLGDGITVERQFAGPETLVCQPALINQVVMNLIANAADALGGQGRITVATRLEGETYVIEIMDDGPGISTEISGRVFEPFFTTKEVGKGTGLGLSIAYGVVRSHGGEISVGAAPGGGALFTVRVPRDRQP